MGKFEDQMAKYRTHLNDRAGVSDIDEGLLEKIARGQGPSIYLNDASQVSCGDEAELDRVRKNFGVKKLGMEEGDDLNNAIQSVCKKYDSRNKLRVPFYYLLTKELGKEDAMA